MSYSFLETRFLISYFFVLFPITYLDFPYLLLYNEVRKIADIIEWLLNLPHNADYVTSLYHKPQAFNLAAMFRTGCHYINTCSIDTAVTQDICQLCNVLFDAIKRTSE